MTKKPDIKGFQYALNAASVQLSRARHEWAESFQSSDTKHPDSWDSYGYPHELDFYNFYPMYKRNAWAKSVVDRPVDKCWQDNPWILTDKTRKGEELNEWEREFEEFAEKHHLWAKERELDRMQSIGQYGAMLIEVRDGKSLSTAIGKVRANQVYNFKVVTEGMLEVGDTEQDEKSERYGLPINYYLNETQYGDKNPDTNSQLEVHYSRLIVWAEGSVNDGIYGNSALEPVFNTLLNIEKVGGAGGEGSWKSSRGSITMNIDKDANLTTLANSFGVKLDELQDEIAAQVEDFNRNLDSVLAAQGVDFKPLTLTIPSPDGFMAIYKDELAAGSGIPLTELIGQQVDERSSTENSKQWAGKCESRQNGFLSRSIRKSIEWLMDIGVISQSKFAVCWDELYQPSMADKLDLVTKMVDANLKHAQALSQLAMVGMTEDTPARVFEVSEMRDLVDYDELDDAEIDEEFGEEDVDPILDQ